MSADRDRALGQAIASGLIVAERLELLRDKGIERGRNQRRPE